MHTDTADACVRRIAPPAISRTSSLLGRIDYQDAFVVEVGLSRTRDAENWIRVILEDAPLGTRLRLLSAWTAIGLTLKLPAPGRTVLGWEIRARDADFVLLGADSRIGMPGELILRRQGTGLLFSTLVRQNNSIARALWASIEPAHVRTVRSLLQLAARRVMG
ncbi:hypothetical protein ABGB19_13730 [Mycobacterium sp. B14F4]|uniref:hypothetical protein n=1 Tax=Mycobacterium sp. B14F4 TaxID=3153565 RepID=UPI00325D2E3D